MTTGERIKARRKSLGMSAEALAERCGLSPATLYRYEKGDIENMRTDKLIPVAEALHTTSAYLMGWEEEEKTPDTLIDIESLSEDKKALIEYVMSLSDVEARVLRGMLVSKPQSEK